MQIINPYLLTARLLIFSLLFCLIPFSSNASQLFYTVQTGSFSDVTAARKQYDFLMKKLTKQEIDYLRIEKIGKYYTVRLGKFENYPIPEKLNQAVKTHISKLVIMKAYIKNERIIKLHTGSSSVDKQEVKEKAMLVPEKIEPRITEKADKKIKTDIGTENIKNTEVHYIRGINFGTSGKHQEAIKAFKQAIRLNPDYAEAYKELGTSYRELLKPQVAIDAFKQAIRIKPDYVEAYKELGTSYFSLHMDKEAVAAYTQAIKINPEDAEAHFMLGFTHWVLKDNSSALDEYKILKDLDKEMANQLFDMIYPE